MLILLDIPKEFEKEYHNDKLNESFERILADYNHFLQKGEFCNLICAGRYEFETIEMLQKSFENSRELTFVTTRDIHL